MSVRIVFAGTPSVALPGLSALEDSDHDVVGIMTRPPARRGRSKALIPSPVAAFAKEHRVPLLETNRPSESAPYEWLRQRGADLGVVVAYGALLKQDVLRAPPRG